MQTSVSEVCPCPSPFARLSPVRITCVVINGDKTDVVDERATIRIQSKGFLLPAIKNCHQIDNIGATR